MKRFTVITACIVLMCAATFYFLSVPYNRTVVSIKDGMLDLTDRDFGNSGLFALDGEWEFYYGELYTPEDFKNGEPGGGSFIRVPMSWEKAGYPLKGCATYRLTILTGEPELALYIPKITFSSAVWINGELVFEAGKPGVTQEETAPGIGTAFINVRPENGRLEILAQAASYNWYVAGLRNGWSIGRPDIMARDAVLRYSLLAMSIGAMIVLALYHLILFVYRHKEKVYLAFALTLLSYALRHVLETNGFVQMLLPGGMGEGLMRLYLATIIFQPMLVVFFTHAAFMVPLRGRLRRAVYILCFAVPAAITFFWPNGLIHADSFLYFVTVPMAWSAVSAARAMKREFNPYNMLYLAAIVAFILWYPIQKVALDDQLFMPGITSHLFLALSQCVMLSVSYAGTKAREAELAAENAALVRFGKMKADLIAMVSHETKTPLAVLSAYSELIAKDLRKEGVKEQTAKDLDRISAEAERIAWLMDELDEKTREKEDVPQKTRLDLAELIEGAERMFRPLLERKNLSLTVHLPEEPPYVYGAAGEVTQALFNLLNNARAHTDAGGVVIKAGLKDRAGYAEVTVSDTGSGISPELLPRLFERGVSGGQGGQGLGLFICKGIIDRHGGEIIVESEPGKGTSVRFTLPLWRDDIDG